MTCHIGNTLDIIYCLQIVHQPIIKGVRRFGCPSKFGELITWQGTQVLVIEGIEVWAIDFLYLMDRTSREGREERDFRDAVGVGLSKTGHGVSNLRVQFFVLYMTVGPINVVYR